MITKGKLSDSLYHTCDNIRLCNSKNIYVDASVSSRQGRCPYCHTNLRKEYDEFIQASTALDKENK